MSENQSENSGDLEIAVTTAQSSRLADAVTQGAAIGCGAVGLAPARD